MNSASTHTEGSAQTPRARSLVIPREHGAWGILLVPLVTGASVGMFAEVRVLPLLLFIAAALALFWMRTPVESWLGTSPLKAQTAAEKNAVLAAIGALASVAAICLTVLLWNGRNSGLLRLGAITGLAFVVQAGLKKLGRSTRMAAQLIGAIGLTSTAPAAYYVVTGQLDTRALALWLANWLFAGNQIHFVQLRIHAARAAGWSERFARGRVFFAGQIVMIVALLVAWRANMMPLLTLAAFLPVLWRGTAWFLGPAQPLAVRRLGWSELAQALAFGVLLVAAFLF